MKKTNIKVKIGALLLAAFVTTACEQGFSSDSNLLENDSTSSTESSTAENQSPSLDENSNNESSSTDQTHNIDENMYSPICESWVDEDVFSKDVNFELTGTMSLAEAKNFVNNDLNNIDETVYTKFNLVQRVKKEVHVTENRSTSTYSIKDRIEEKRNVRMIDSVNKWRYERMSEDSKNVYFVEDDLINHFVRERLYYYKDNYLYYIFSESNYYEGQEDRGTYKAYYQKISGLSEEEINNYFCQTKSGWSYFGPSGLSTIENKLGNNFIYSTSYYTIGDYDLVGHETSYSFASTGNGYFGCYVNDTCSYNFDNLIDYPSIESTVLKSIDYEQKYLLNITNYSSYTENYATTSVSKTEEGNILRNESRKGATVLKEECEIFYPDLTKFVEKEYQPPVSK